MRDFRSTEQPPWMTALVCAAVVLAMTAPAGAQMPSCTTLGSPQCAPATFGDSGQFQVGDLVKSKCCARQVVSHGIMPLCGGDMFCPQTNVTRGDMAVFLEDARHPTATSLPAAIGVFADVPIAFPLACWIEVFYNDGITAGCGTNPLRYCPDSSVSRAEMAVFILKAKKPPGYAPPNCDPQHPMFADVPCPSGFAVNWIEEFARECITAGCGGGNFCPTGTVTREQMGIFLWNAFVTSSPCTASCS